MTNVMGFARLYLTYLGAALCVCSPSAAQSQEKEWVPATCPGVKDTAPQNVSVAQSTNCFFQLSQPEQPMKKLVQDVVQVGSAWKLAKSTRETTEEDVQKYLRISLFSKEKAEKLAPKIHKIWTSEGMQKLSSGILIGTGAFTMYTTIGPLWDQHEKDRLFNQRLDKIRAQDSQKKP